MRIFYDAIYVGEVVNVAKDESKITFSLDVIGVFAGKTIPSYYRDTVYIYSGKTSCQANMDSGRQYIIPVRYSFNKNGEVHPYKGHCARISGNYPFYINEFKKFYFS